MICYVIYCVLVSRQVIVSTQLLTVSGTGKTATFAIGILQRLEVSNKNCQALLLAPTRELSHCIVRFIQSMGTFMNISIHSLCHGVAIRDHVRILQEGATIEHPY